MSSQMKKRYTGRGLGEMGVYHPPSVDVFANLEAL